MTTAILDLHHHILPPDYMKALGSRIGSQGLLGRPPQWSPAASVEAMDRNGIKAAVTSISSPGVWFGDSIETQRLARSCNEYAARIKADYPGRFGFFAVLPLPDVDASLREIEYAMEVLGADGVGLLSNYGGTYPGDDRLAPVFDELNRRKMVVFFHPTVSAGWTSLPDIPVPSLEFPFDTTRAITNLLLTGTFTRCRDVRFVFAHAGGALPFLAARINRLMIVPKFRDNVPDGVFSELKHIYFDVALSANPIAFGPLLQVAGDANIVFGSDYPHAGEPTLAATVSGLNELGLDAARLEGIASGNARALFPGILGDA